MPVRDARLKLLPATHSTKERNKGMKKDKAMDNETHDVTQEWNTKVHHARENEHMDLDELDAIANEIDEDE